VRQRSRIGAPDPSLPPVAGLAVTELVERLRLVDQCRSTSSAWPCLPWLWWPARSSLRPSPRRSAASDRLPALEPLLTAALIILTIALTNEPALIARLLMNHW